MSTARKVVQLGNQLRELRIHLCQTSKSSAGVREFIENHYVDLKKQNPGFPILIRECSGIEPKLIGRYGKGVESSSVVSGAKADDVIAVIEALSKAE